MKIIFEREPAAGSLHIFTRDFGTFHFNICVVGPHSQHNKLDAVYAAVCVIMGEWRAAWLPSGKITVTFVATMQSSYCYGVIQEFLSAILHYVLQSPLRRLHARKVKNKMKPFIRYYTLIISLMSSAVVFLGKKDTTRHAAEDNKDHRRVCWPHVIFSIMSPILLKFGAKKRWCMTSCWYQNILMHKGRKN